MRCEEAAIGLHCESHTGQDVEVDTTEYGDTEVITVRLRRKKKELRTERDANPVMVTVRRANFRLGEEDPPVDLEDPLDKEVQALKDMP